MRIGLDNFLCGYPEEKDFTLNKTFIKCYNSNIMVKLWRKRNAFF